MNALRPLFTLLVVLCLLCAHCNLAKPTGSMTRIQEVFRTLMGAKPMMLASRGKKSLVALPSNVREFWDAQAEADDGEGMVPAASSYWLVADERLPLVAVRLSGEER